MTKRILFDELRSCKKVALACDSYECGVMSVREARGMIKLAYTLDIINTREFHTLMRLVLDFQMYLLESKPIREIEP